MSERRECDRIEPFLDYLVDGQPLPEAEQQFVQAHLARCESCRRKLDELRRLDAQIRAALKGELEPHPSLEELSALVDGTELDPSRRRRLLLHLERCDTCREDLERLRLLQEKWQAHEERNLDHLRGRRWFALIAVAALQRRRVLAVAAAALVLATGLWFFERAGRQPAPQQLVTQQVPTPGLAHPESTAAPAATPGRPGLASLAWAELKKRFAERFKPTPYLEGMLALNTRGEELLVVSPEPGSRQVGVVRFRWKGRTGRVTLVILNNRGKPVVTAHPSGQEYVLRRKLPPGLYYWKLETDEELLYVGKFEYRPE